MNNRPKFLPHPTSWARGFALSISFWLIVSVLWPHAYYYSYGFNRMYWYTIRNSDFKNVMIFAWLCQIWLFAFYHWGVTRVTEWVEIRRENQPLATVSKWQHGREGIIAFLTLPAGILMGVPAIAIFMLPVNSSSGALIAVILGTAIASSYLYYFRFGQLLKNIIQPLWVFVINLLKIFELLLVPIATGSPFFMLTISTAKIIPQQLLPLTTFCLVVCVFLSGIVGYAALQYWSAHLVNWVATWWPKESPGYSHLQTRIAWKHNKTVRKQSFIRHSTSWNLAANDATNLIYLNAISVILGFFGYLVFGDASKWTQIEEEILGLVALVAWMVPWYFWGWRSEVEIASGKPEGKKRRSTNSKSQPPNQVEQELNRIKTESGMNRIKSVRPKPPTPEVPEWYVFRSGEAKGPYSKLELWEIESITARTKVRRGQAEWVRAGEIPELVPYLTQK